jgi:hypothetical protein
VSLLAGSTLETVARLAGLGVLSAALAAAVAFAHRLGTRETVPTGLAMLVGLGGVAVYLNTTADLGTVMGGGDVQTRYALVNLAAFAIGAVGAWVGAAGGDRYETDIFGGDVTDVDRDVGTMVTAVGRVLTVALPEEIDDIVGYDPVAPATKAAIAGRRFVFPKRLPVDELTERLRNRLKTDYGVGHVDLDLGADGTVHYLAVGSRVAGIGPTLPPATNAMAIRADPAFAASAGDLVQVWERQPSRHVLTAELRGVSDDVVTVAVDAADTPTLDPTERYRLVTLPVEDRPDREFASLLRAAPETMATVTVAAGSDLDGAPVGAVPAMVVAIRQPDESIEAIPPRSRPLSAGEELYAIGTPAALRRAEAAATRESEEGAGAHIPPTEQPPAAESSDDADGGEAKPGTGPVGGAEKADDGQPVSEIDGADDAVDEPPSEVADTGERVADEQTQGELSEPEPGDGEPGKDEPGKDEPGKDEPGKDEPGKDEPGKGDTGEEELPEDELAEDEPGEQEPEQGERSAGEPEPDLPGEPDPLELPDEGEPGDDWPDEDGELSSFDDMQTQPAEEQGPPAEEAEEGEEGDSVDDGQAVNGDARTGADGDAETGAAGDATSNDDDAATSEDDGVDAGEDH